MKDVNHMIVIEGPKYKIIIRCDQNEHAVNIQKLAKKLERQILRDFVRLQIV